MNNIFAFILTLLTFVFLNAQNDTIVQPYNPFFDNTVIFEVDARLIEKKIEIAKTPEIKTNLDISHLFVSKSKQLGLSYNFDINKYLNPNKKPIKSMVLKETPLDADIMVIRYFDGKNTTKSDFKTSQNLGTIQSNTEFVRIEYRDFGLIDGDRVKVFLNEKVVDANVHLDGLYYTLHIKLDKKGFNKIDIQAINQGYVGPNTAEFIIYDDKGNVISHKTWNLKTNQMATLGIVKY